MLRTTLLSLVATVFSSVAFGQTANLQVIHNCPAPAAASVDVWLGNTKLLPNFQFRTATRYLSVPANVPLDIRIKVAGSTDTTNPVFRSVYTLPANANVVAIATGNVGTGFAANPNAVSTAFNLEILTDGRLTSTAAGAPQVKVFHGAPDAPTVRVKVARTTTVLVPQAAFRQSSGWLTTPAANLELDVDAFANGATVARFSAPLTAFVDSSILVLASGYLTPSANNNGPAFGLLAVTPKGRTILLPSVALTAGLQVVHNCPAPAASSVDVWLGNTKLLPNFQFRKATGFLTVPANTNLQIRIKGANSTDTARPLFYRSYNLPPDAVVSAIATGNIGTGFAANPNSISTAFDLTILDQGRTRSTVAGAPQVRVFHGAPDAPTVRVKVSGTSTVLVPQASFRQASGWIDAPLADLALDVDNFATGQTVVTYLAPLTAFADSALLVMASGYLTPASNNNGPAFGLIAITAKGRSIALPTTPTAVLGRSTAKPVALYPNPATNQVRFTLPEGTLASAEVRDMTGRTVLTLDQAGNNTLDVSGLTPGLYYLTARSTTGVVYQARLVRK